MQLTGAQALLLGLRAEQVRWVFGIASGKLTPLMHALSLTPEMRFVGLRHEASGAMMAAALYASTGRVAVALGEMAPGGINLAAGAGVAFNNHLAALLLTTNQHRAAAYPHRGMFMDMDQMIGSKYEQGLASMEEIVEAATPESATPEAAPVEPTDESSSAEAPSER